MPEQSDLIADHRPATFSQSLLAARVVSLLALAATLAGTAWVGASIYDGMTDAFVAPIILSPTSDVVLQSKLNLGRMQAERSALLVRIEESQDALRTAKLAGERLIELKSWYAKALGFSGSVTAEKQVSAAGALGTLAEERALLTASLAQQTESVTALARDVEAGLMTRADLARAQGELQELRLALLQNQRARLALTSEYRQSALAQRALAKTSVPSRVSTPEMLAQREQLVKLDLELARLEAETRSKTAQLRTDTEHLGKLDELIGELLGRPLFRAIERKHDIAFVPYTQLSGVSKTASVLHCSIWGIFSCKPVGKVLEVLPGEVAMQDPWGTPARGVYAVLALSDTEAAQAKSLRVRARERRFDLALGSAFGSRAAK